MSSKIGSRAQVMHGNAIKTTGGLMKKDLKYNKQGKIVSKKASALAKKENRLVKAGYITKKGIFGFKFIGGGQKRSLNNYPNIIRNPIKRKVIEYKEVTPTIPVSHNIAKIEDIEKILNNIEYLSLEPLNKIYIIYQLLDLLNIDEDDLYNQIYKDLDEKRYKLEKKINNNQPKQNINPIMARGGDNSPKDTYLLMAHGSYPLSEYRENGRIKDSFICESKGYTIYICDIGQGTKLSAIKKFLNEDFTPNKIKQYTPSVYKLCKMIYTDNRKRIIIFPPGVKMLNIQCTFDTFNQRSNKYVPIGLYKNNDKNNDIENLKKELNNNKYPSNNEVKENYNCIKEDVQLQKKYLTDFMPNFNTISKCDNIKNMSDNSVLIMGVCRGIKGLKPNRERWIALFNETISKIEEKNNTFNYRNI